MRNIWIFLLFTVKILFAGKKSIHQTQIEFSMEGWDTGLTYILRLFAVLTKCDGHRTRPNSIFFKLHKKESQSKHCECRPMNLRSRSNQ